MMIAAAGDVRRELASIRRKRALFHLAFEGNSHVVLSTDFDRFGVVSSYRDHGYQKEPFEAHVITITNGMDHEVIDFHGRTPEELVDAMSSLYESWKESQT